MPRTTRYTTNGGRVPDTRNLSSQRMTRLPSNAAVTRPAIAGPKLSDPRPDRTSSPLSTAAPRNGGHSDNERESRRVRPRKPQEACASNRDPDRETPGARAATYITPTNATSRSRISEMSRSVAHARSTTPRTGRE